MTQWIIVADDLTGACDAGAAFAACGLETVVAFHAAFAPDVQVLVLNSESRGLPEAAAVRAVEDVFAPAAMWIEHARVFKKMDSTLRGHPAAELRALMRLVGADKALVAPSFPEQGRTVIEGRVLVGDQPIEETPFGEEIPSGDLQRLFGGHVLPLSAVRQREADLAAHLRLGIGNWLVDSTTPADLDRAAAAGLSAGLRLFCGSAGLARALARQVRILEAALPNFSGPAHRPVLVLAGSRHPATLCQVARVEQAGVRVLDLPGAFMAEEAFIQLRRQAVEALSGSRQAVVISLRGMDLIPGGERQIMETMGRLAAQILEDFSPVRLILTGGDTAAAACKALICSQIRLLGEAQPGIALGRLINGRRPGLEVITKAGGFGDEDALLNLM